MKPFIVLLVATIIAAAIIHFAAADDDIALAARIGMSAMLLFTALGHFMFSKGMAMMLPAHWPFTNAIVYITGIIEIAAAAGLLIPAVQHVTGWLLTAFFICILPANIYAANKGLNYQTGELNGPGKNYLWFRVPLQLLFIAWVYFSAIYCSR